MRLGEQQQANNFEEKSKCPFCHKLFYFTVASSEFREAICFCSENCRIRYWMRHHNEEEKGLEL